MNLFGLLELSCSALGAERQRAEVVASNMAHAQTTRTPAGGPYRRQLVVFQAQRVPRFALALAGFEREHSSAVRVAAVVPDQRPPVMRFEPGHPDANAEGYVAYLRIVFDCSLVSAEHLTFLEFIQRIPEKAYLASIDLAPVGATAVLQLDLTIAFPIIDVMLGGEGKSGEITRAITEIEEEVLEGIVRIMCRELQTAWQTIALEFNFGVRQQLLQTQRLMPPEEKSLCLSFEIKMSETRGTLNLAIPAVVSNALLRKISADFSFQRRRGPIEGRLQIQKKLLNCFFSVELSMRGLQVPLENITALAPGDLLTFSRNASAPAVMLVDGVPLCSAAPVRVNNRRAASVLSLETPLPPKDEL
ncbi:MAG: FliM/FliN family flagellar motor switch protein [Terriglobales bacterium]